MNEWMKCLTSANTTITTTQTSELKMDQEQCSPHLTDTLLQQGTRFNTSTHPFLVCEAASIHITCCHALVYLWVTSTKVGGTNSSVCLQHYKSTITKQVHTWSQWSATTSRCLTCTYVCKTKVLSQLTQLTVGRTDASCHSQTPCRVRDFWSLYTLLHTFYLLALKTLTSNHNAKCNECIMLLTAPLPCIAEPLNDGKRQCNARQHSVANWMFHQWHH